jgi:hypothetical protein
MVGNIQLLLLLLLLVLVLAVVVVVVAAVAAAAAATSRRVTLASPRASRQICLLSRPGHGAAGGGQRLHVADANMVACVKNEHGQWWPRKWLCSHEPNEQLTRTTRPSLRWEVTLPCQSLPSALRVCRGIVRTQA